MRGIPLHPGEKIVGSRNRCSNGGVHIHLDAAKTIGCAGVSVLVCLAAPSFDVCFRVFSNLARNSATSLPRMMNGGRSRRMCSCVQLMTRPLRRACDNDRRAVDRQVNAQDQALAANFADEIKALGELFETGAQLRAALANVGEQARFFDDRQEFQRSGADKRSAAESCAMHARDERRCELLVGDNRAERQPAGERFGDRHDVRLPWLETSDTRNSGRCGRVRIEFRRRSARHHAAWRVRGRAARMLR